MKQINDLEDRAVSSHKLKVKIWKRWFMQMETKRKPE